MKISKTIVYLIVSAIILISVLYVLIPSKSEDARSEDISEVNYNKLDEIIFNVKTKEIKRGELVKKIVANGIVRAAKELDITSNINGIIDEINIYEGKYVNANEILVKLDDRESKINLREAEERIIEAKVNYGLLIKDAPEDEGKSKEQERIEEALKNLELNYENKNLSKSEYELEKDDLEMKLIFTGAKREELILNKSGYNAAVNQIERAKLNLEYTKIRAPFNGVVGDFDLVVGQRIVNGNKLFKLFSTYIMNIDINILESELNKIEIGNDVEITIPAIPNEKFYGKVSRVSPYIDTESRTSKVVISIRNKDSKIKPGMFASVLIASKKYSDRILIPKEALLVRDKRNLVFTVKDSLAKWKYVEIGESNNEFIEVLKGVNEGEQIIVEGHFNLAHDSRVKVVE